MHHRLWCSSAGRRNVVLACALALSTAVRVADGISVSASRPCSRPEGHPSGTADILISLPRDPADDGPSAAAATADSAPPASLRLTPPYTLIDGAIVPAWSGPGSSVARLPSGVPMVLHQSWPSRPPPPQLLAWASSWARTQPDWHHVLWSDCDNRALVATHYPDFLDTYDGYPQAIQRADAARYLVLHKYGGLYADLDYESIGDMSAVLGNTSIDVFIVETPWAGSEGETVQNSLMASKPGADLWVLVKELMVLRKPPLWQQWVGFTKVLATTGPLLLQDAMALLPSQTRVMLLPAAGFHSPNGAFAVHHNAYTWKMPRAIRSAVGIIWVNLAVLLIVGSWAWWPAQSRWRAQGPGAQSGRQAWFITAARVVTVIGVAIALALWACLDATSGAGSCKQGFFTLVLGHDARLAWRNH